MSRPRLPHLFAALSLALCALLASGFAGLGAASGATGLGSASITHMEPTKDGVDVLVTVPSGSPVDLSKVSVDVDGTALPASATKASDSSAVARTAILLMDVSQSMRGAKLTAAKAAAKQYVASLPSDVALGIVTFAGDVKTVLRPTKDRSHDDALIDGLTTSVKTHLYDGVQTAVQTAGTVGQRSILLLSDGADQGSEATLAQAVGMVKQGGVLLDAVGLGQTGPAADALQQLAKAGHGRVLQSDPATIAQSFQAEAGLLEREVLVSATFPAGFTQTSGQLTVTLPAGDSTLTASALATNLQSPAPAPAPADPSPKKPMVLPDWAMWLGVLAFAVGLLALGLALIPRPKVVTVEDRVTSYTATVTRAGSDTDKPHEDQLATAKAAAEGLLRHSAGLEARIEARLDAAGSPLRPAEWLLVHVGIAFLVTVLGLLVGRGNVIIALLFLVVGIVAPWVYLGLKRGRRIRAFNESLPDTLQLMSGSLSAGLSLNQSVDTVVREGAEPISSEFKRVLVETRLGVGLEDALDGIAERFDSDDFRWCVMAIRIQRQVGGNLAELLNTVAETMRERQYLRRQVQTLAAEGKMSAWVIGALPPLLLAYMLLVDRSYVMTLFTDIKGIVLFCFGAAWLGVGAFWMSRLIKVEA